jgi:hypothetical protein
MGQGGPVQAGGAPPYRQAWGVGGGGGQGHVVVVVVVVGGWVGGWVNTEGRGCQIGEGSVCQGR